MAATRVYILARELGVKSSAIIEKCQAEDLDVKNHMSTISAGLAATICEWFSEGGEGTAVETAKKVDLEKVRVKRKRKTKAAAEQAAETAEQEPTEEAATEPQAVAEAVEEEQEVQQAVEATATEAAVEEVKTEEAPEAVAEAKEAEAEAQEVKPVEEAGEAEVKEKAEPAKPSGPQIVEPPAEPEPVVPAGPMLEKPKPAQLSGPQVVRIEAPEPERFTRSRPKPRTRPRHNEPATEPLMPGAPAPAASGDAGHKKAKRGKDRTHGRRHDEMDTANVKRSKYEQMRRQRDIEERQARLNAAGGAGRRVRPSRKITAKSQKDHAAIRPDKATISEPVTVKDLSAALAVKASEIIFKLMQQGVMATANQTISSEVAELVALEFGTELTIEKKEAGEDVLAKEFDEREKKNLTGRPVVATMLGHVDHGKTSLLDRIRSSHVAAGEAGGITQHISTYQVNHNGKKITFLDTPGHAAFTEMRARGANMTDVVILVIAADDGVMPQTIEVINHAKAADVQIIVALNKIDLPGVDINRIYSQLSEHELVPAEWGGDTEIVKTSATTGQGIDDLLEHLEYIADLLELKADDTVPAAGRIVEAKMSAQKGVIATVLIQEGCLKKGDVVLTGKSFGRIKAMKNTFGKVIKKAVSSTPVVITGLDEVPEAGDRFYCLGSDLSRAKNIADENKVLSRESSLAQRTQVTLDNLFTQIEAGSVKELNVIIRADVQGSVDVLIKYLSELSTEDVKIKILHSATGGITEGDVVLAEASNAIIIGFNVVAEERVSKIAEGKGVDIRLYTVIYRITEDLEKSMVGMLEPEQQEKNVGRAMVRDTFKVSRIGTIAGCYVTDGMAKNKATIHLIRNNVVVRDDLQIESLKHFKDDVREVKAGLECGIKLAKFDDIKVDDIFEFFETVEVARTLR